MNIKKLRMLERDYFDQPAHLRRKDIIVINDLRAALGLVLVDANLQPIPEAPVTSTETLAHSPAPVRDPFAEARAVYTAYAEKQAFLEPHRRYADRIIRLTQPVRAKTPVMPLAIMGGSDGRPMLCDVCGKQIPLEDPPFKGVGARDAWDKVGWDDDKLRRWVSYILNHLNVIQETNGTLRVYHGHYDQRGGTGCAEAAEEKLKQQVEDFKKTRNVPRGLQRQLEEFAQTELGIGLIDPTASKDFARDVISDMFLVFDPGIGINGP